MPTLGPDPAQWPCSCEAAVAASLVLAIQLLGATANGAQFALFVAEPVRREWYETPFAR